MADPVKKVGEFVRDRPARVGKDQQRDAAHQKHRGERHHDRLKAHEGDEESVEGADRSAHREASKNNADLCCRAVLRRGGDERVHQRDDRARRKIEAANEDDKRLPDGGKRERGAAADDRIDVVVAEPRPARSGRRTADRQANTAMIEISPRFFARPTSKVGSACGALRVCRAHAGKLSARETAVLAKSGADEHLLVKLRS